MDLVKPNEQVPKINMELPIYSNNHEPLITIIIPTYRRPGLLVSAIKSVQRQTCPSFRVGVFDNASGDDTSKVVKEIARQDKRISYYCHPENIGAYGNFIAGMKSVLTPFFSFLSDDDALLPNFLEDALKGFQRYPNAAFSACSVISISQELGFIKDQLSSWNRDGYFEPPAGLLQMIEYGHPTWTGIVFRSEVIKEVGLLDPEIGALSDMDFELRIAARFPFFVNAKPGAVFFEHPTSYCSQERDITFFWPGMEKMALKLETEMNLSSEARNTVSVALRKKIFRNLLGTSFLLERRFGEAIKASEILSNFYGIKWRGLIYRIFVFGCKYFPPLLSAIIIRQKIRNYSRERRRQRLKEKYEIFISEIGTRN